MAYYPHFHCNAFKSGHGVFEGREGKERRVSTAERPRRTSFAKRFVQLLHGWHAHGGRKRKQRQHEHRAASAHHRMCMSSDARLFSRFAARADTPVTRSCCSDSWVSSTRLYRASVTGSNSRRRRRSFRRRTSHVNRHTTHSVGRRRCLLIREAGGVGVQNRKERLRIVLTRTPPSTLRWNV